MIPMDADSLRAYATRQADYYGLDMPALIATIECESGFNATSRGDHGLARGIAQIRSDYWPDITEAQADDPYWALDWMIEKWREGREELWSCYRNLKKT